MLSGLQIQSKHISNTKQVQSKYKVSIVHDQSMGNMCFGVLCVQDSWHMNTIFLLRLRPCIASSYLIICHTDVSALFVDHLLGMAKPLLPNACLAHRLCHCHTSMKSLQNADKQQSWFFISSCSFFPFSPVFVVFPVHVVLSWLNGTGDP